MIVVNTIKLYEVKIEDRKKDNFTKLSFLEYL